MTFLPAVLLLSPRMDLAQETAPLIAMASSSLVAGIGPSLSTEVAAKMTQDSRKWIDTICAAAMELLHLSMPGEHSDVDKFRRTQFALSQSIYSLVASAPLLPQSSPSLSEAALIIFPVLVLPLLLPFRLAAAATLGSFASNLPSLKEPAAACSFAEDALMTTTAALSGFTSAVARRFPPDHAAASNVLQEVLLNLLGRDGGEGFLRPAAMLVSTLAGGMLGGPQNAEAVQGIKAAGCCLEQLLRRAEETLDDAATAVAAVAGGAAVAVASCSMEIPQGPALAPGSGDLQGPALAAMREVCALVLPILGSGLVEVVTLPQLVRTLTRQFVLELYLRALLSLTGITRALAGVVDLYLQADESQEDILGGGIDAMGVDPGSSSSGVGGGPTASKLWKQCGVALEAATSSAEHLAVATAKMSVSIASGAEDGSSVVGDVAARSTGGQCVHADESASSWAEQTDWASQQTRELAAAVHGAALSFCMACDHVLLLPSASA